MKQFNKYLSCFLVLKTPKKRDATSMTRVRTLEHKHEFERKNEKTKTRNRKSSAGRMTRRRKPEIKVSQSNHPGSIRQLNNIRSRRQHMCNKLTSFIEFQVNVTFVVCFALFFLVKESLKNQGSNVRPLVNLTLGISFK